MAFLIGYMKEGWGAEWKLNITHISYDISLLISSVKSALRYIKKNCFISLNCGFYFLSFSTSCIHLSWKNRIGKMMILLLFHNKWTSSKMENYYSFHDKNLFECAGYSHWIAFTDILLNIITFKLHTIQKPNGIETLHQNLKVTV